MQLYSLKKSFQHSEAEGESDGEVRVKVGESEGEMRVKVGEDEGEMRVWVGENEGEPEVQLPSPLHPLSPTPVIS
jgi:hypothetical protein